MNEKTRIPLPWFFTFIGSSVSLAVIGINITLYIARIESKAEAANKIIEDQKKEMEEMKTTWQTSLTDQINYLRSIDQRLSRIEGQIHGRK